jgi:hypothetical protein
MIYYLLLDLKEYNIAEAENFLRNRNQILSKA